MLLDAPIVTDPPVVQMPAPLASALAQSSAQGRTMASAWLADHPAPTESDAAAYILSTIPPVPDAPTEAHELDAVRGYMRPVSTTLDDAANWYSGPGYPLDLKGETQPSWWTGQLAGWQQRTSTAPGGAAQAAAGAAQLHTALHLAGDVWSTSQQQTHEARPVVALGLVTGKPQSWWYTSHPSGHASEVFAASTAMSALDPANAASYGAVADRVAWSRLRLAMHFPHDVIIGARVGAMAATIAPALVPAPTAG